MYKSLILLLILLTGCYLSNEKTLVMFYTSQGNIQMELYPDKAPATTANFLHYTKQKIYDGSLFYRTVNAQNQASNPVKIAVIQGGLFEREAELHFPAIHHENTKTTGIQHENGTISMARADTGTVTSEFFICIGNQPELDYGGKRNPDLQGFAAFGKVTQGMELVKTIHQLPDENQYLIEQVIIDSIRIIQ
ncbi:MAG: peptidylprolyl isomerase [Prolixibacteraceae bacterium]|nr:peptidylprolyl isomerase [Prolixibacteraceae bacterium]